jgi:membrane-associated phospholipid phosphatase
MPLLALICAAVIHLMQVNNLLFRLINAHALSLMEPALWETLTILGDGLVAITLLLPIYKHNPKPVLAMLIAGLIAALGVHLLKGALEVQRPAAVLEPGLIMLLGPKLMHGSFPSGHTATLFALLGCLALWLKGPLLRSLFPILVAIGLLAAISRSAVGAHWPLDILVGAAIGWSSAMLATLIANRLLPQRVSTVWLGRFLTLCALYLLFVHHTGYNDAQPVLRGIALFALGMAAMEHLRERAPSIAHTSA